MLNVIKYAVSIFKDEKAWAELQKNCMRSDISWKESAKEYKKLYSKLMNVAEKPEKIEKKEKSEKKKKKTEKKKNF